MTWKVLYFGKRQPSIKRQLMIHLLMFFLFATPYAIWGDFSPQNWVVSFGCIVSLFVTIISAFLIWKNIEKLKQHPRVMLQSPRQRNFGFCALPIVVFCFCGLFFVYSLPAILTIIIGQEFEVSATFEKKDSNSRKSCNYRVTSEMLSELMPSYMCISEAQFNRETNKFSVSGKESIFGRLYQHIE